MTRLLLGLIVLVTVGCGPREVSRYVADQTGGGPSPRVRTGSPAPDERPRSVKLLEDYSAIDRHALAAPPEAERSLKSLAAWLGKPARNDRQKARAIYRWVTDRMEYDAAAFLARRFGSRDAEAALRSRKGVCAEFAALFQALAQQAGLEAKIVSGVARGYGYRPGAALPSKPDHDWNAVKLDGEWFLVDCTWGAGYLDPATKAFVPRFTDFWFLTEPRVFLYKHLPKEERWTLLDQPVGPDAFARLPNVSPPFFEYALKLENHDGNTLKSDGPLTLEISHPENVAVLARLCRDGQDVGPGSVLVQRRPGGHTVKALFREAGAHELVLFAGPRGEGTLPEAVSYAVAVSRPTPDAAFPYTYGAYGTRGARLLQPQEGTLRAGQPVEFVLEAPGADLALVQSSSGQVRLQKEGDRFTGTAAAGAGEVILFARYPGKDQLEGLVRFQAE